MLSSHPVPNQVKWHKTLSPWIAVSFSGLFSAFSLNQNVFVIIWTQMSFHADGWIFHSDYGNCKKNMKSKISSPQKKNFAFKILQRRIVFSCIFQPQRPPAPQPLTPSKKFISFITGTWQIPPCPFRPSGYSAHGPQHLRSPWKCFRFFYN